MWNVSLAMLISSFESPKKKWDWTFRRPEVYDFDGVAEYLEKGHRMRVPWYKAIDHKRFGEVPCALASIDDVALEYQDKVENGTTSSPRFNHRITVRDSTGELDTFWCARTWPNFYASCAPYSSFETFVEREPLAHGEVYDVLLTRVMPPGESAFTVIMDVDRHEPEPPSRRKTRKKLTEYLELPGWSPDGVRNPA